MSLRRLHYIYKLQGVYRNNDFTNYSNLVSDNYIIIIILLYNFVQHTVSVGNNFVTTGQVCSYENKI